MNDARLGHLAGLLERAVVALALLAIAFRVVVYGRLPRPAGAAWGTGDVIDYALALALFLLALACAGSAVLLSARAGSDATARARAWRPAVIGMTAFVAYYLVHPYLPVL
ncbi:MAG: hypothetical protein RLW61_09240 [Gammaproteobacteria bacterium]